MQHYDFIKNLYTINRPLNVSWDITNKCNLSCKHCFNYSGDAKHHDFKQEFSRSKALDIASQLVEMKISQCCICGGETTLCPYLIDIITILSSGGVKTNIVSNGLLIDDGYAYRLKKSGVNNVQISVDGLGYQHDKFRNKEGAFDKAITAIKHLKNHKVDTLISFCPNKFNYKGIDDYIEYMCALGCFSIRMMPLLPLGRGKENYEDLCLTDWEQFAFIGKIVEIRQKYPEIKIEWGDPLEHITLVMVNKRRTPAIMGILSNGDISVTPYLSISVANVYQNSLKEIWDLGYRKIWQKKEIVEIIKNIYTIHDLGILSQKEFCFELL